MATLDGTIHLVGAGPAADTWVSVISATSFATGQDDFDEKLWAGWPGIPLDDQLEAFGGGMLYQLKWTSVAPDPQD